VAAIGRLEGVYEATLCETDGTVIESSSNRPELNAAATSLVSAMQALETSLHVIGSPVTLTVDAEHGSLHLAQGRQAVLVVTTGTEANLGAVRLEMREALRAMGELPASGRLQ
jgi:predicted regulator of Ras-like GTPase activity (Roadblock/LC7/MglB family)